MYEEHLHLVRILKADDSTAGSGFLITNKHILTCAHVVEEALKSNNISDEGCFEAEFPAITDSKIKVKIHKKYWYPPTPDYQALSDIAVLEIQNDLHKDCEIRPWLELDRFKLKECYFNVAGFPEVYDKNNCLSEISKHSQTSENRIIDKSTNGLLQVQDISHGQGYAIESGFSGAPAILQEDKKPIIGMVVACNNGGGKRLGYVIPTNCLYQALGLPKNWKDLEGIVSGLKLFALRELVADINIPNSTFHLFLNTFKLNLREPFSTEKDSLQNFLSFLAQIPNTLEQAPLFQFLEYISDSINQKELIDWKNDAAKSLKLDLLAIRYRVSEIKRQQRIDASPPVILVKIISDILSDEHFLVWVWVYQNNQYSPPVVSNKEFNFQQLNEDFNKILVKAITEQLGGVTTGELIIEMLLPIRLLGWDVNHIDVIDGFKCRPLGKLYAVNIRSSDRIYGSNFHNSRGRWRKKWIGLRELQKSINGQHIDYLHKHTHYDDLFDTLDQSKAFVFVPTCAIPWQTKHFDNIFSAAINAGVPVIFWSDKNSMTTEKIKAIEELIFNHSVTKWISEIHAQKAQKLFSDDLIIFCDDHDRLPPDVDYTLTMPN